MMTDGSQVVAKVAGTWYTDGVIDGVSNTIELFSKYDHRVTIIFYAMVSLKQ